MLGLRERPLLIASVSALYAFSSIPGVHAYCFIDDFGRRRCTGISTGARIGIAIAAIVLFILAFALFRQSRLRSARRTNLAYVGTMPTGGAVPPPGQAPPGYPPPGTNGFYYSNNQPYAPQYPPQTYNGQTPYASPNPPPGEFSQYAPPPGPPPVGGYTPPAGPPPGQGELPQYAPPPGPPPATDYKQTA
ncbi:hypothetical protein C8Q78DRAFT_388062 [Trametes maxima]|nr:hypothetical protein C8Q78DRAFT_388062 [Trametes maxima]